MVSEFFNTHIKEPLSHYESYVVDLNVLPSKASLGSVPCIAPFHALLLWARLGSILCIVLWASPGSMPCIGKSGFHLTLRKSCVPCHIFAAMDKSGFHMTSLLYAGIQLLLHVHECCIINFVCPSPPLPPSYPTGFGGEAIPVPLWD